MAESISKAFSLARQKTPGLKFADFKKTYEKGKATEAKIEASQRKVDVSVVQKEQAEEKAKTTASINNTLAVVHPRLAAGLGFSSLSSGNQRCHCLSNEFWLLTPTSLIHD